MRKGQVIKQRIHKPTGIVNFKTRTGALSQRTEQRNLERDITTLRDIVQCGALFVADILALEAPPVEAVLIGITVAQCIPNLMSDIPGFPDDAHEAVHNATSLLTPWGMGAALITAFSGESGRMISAAKQTNALFDVFKFGMDAKNMNVTEKLVEGSTLGASIQKELAEMAEWAAALVRENSEWVGFGDEQSEGNSEGSDQDGEETSDDADDNEEESGSEVYGDVVL